MYMMNKVNKERKFSLIFLVPALGLLGFILVPSLIYSCFYLLNDNDMINQLLANTIYSIIIIIILIKSLKKEFILYKNNFKSFFIKGLKYWGIGFLIMVFSNLIINMYIFNGEISANENAIRSVLSEYPLIIIISSVILAPIIEEITFRKIFRVALDTKWLYILTSAFVFGFLHAITDLDNILDLLYIIPYGALGGAFAYMYYDTKSIYTSMVVHFLHNAITIALILLSSTVV